MIEATQNVHQGALTGTAGPHQRHELGAGDLLGNPSEHRQIQLTKVVSLADIVKFDQFHILHPPWPSLASTAGRGLTLPAKAPHLRYKWTGALALIAHGSPFAFIGDHPQTLGQSFAADFRPY